MHCFEYTVDFNVMDTVYSVTDTVSNVMDTFLL